MTQCLQDGNVLQVAGGRAFYNGKSVVYSDETLSQEEETISLGDLPNWAQRAISNTGRGMTQLRRDGSMLQISDGQARFNGKKVILSSK
jgi:hypothetical protein